jgi:acid phosphatase family membrane protein YuiD
VKEIAEHIAGNGYEVLVSLSIANLVAQAIKIVTVAIKRKSVKWTILFATGGMPSSHSSTVTAMATSVGIIDGFSSTTFAIAVCAAVIVMFDAAGVRRNASKHAKVLNSLVQELLSPDHFMSREKLKEFLGHTPLEVFAGAGLGVALAVALNFYLGGLI